IASETRKSLDRAISKSSPQSVTARFYLGRVERMLGRDREALNHFAEVLSIMPNHGEATSEIRVIESRMASGDDKSKSGLFGRIKR
ncbi:MAG TPA: tetratricopeptide repeat protein, partial [Kofleriaceae bacterium]|nr:tetratricopeptide repeat protein [Kofleriaceae bacterium]